MAETSNSPQVSIIIPAYNAQKYIQQTLDSILAQSFPDFEVLVIDDGSTDRTAEITNGAGEKVTLIRQENSGGPSQPRNVGIERARGELVAFCDCDDVMLGEKLAASVSVFAKHPDVDFLFTDFQVIDEQGSVLSPSFLAGYQSFRSALRPTVDNSCHLLSGKDLERELFLGNFIGTSSVMARRQRLLELGGFDEDLPNSEDIDLWLRLARTGAVFALLNRPLHSYRKRPGSLSQGGSVKVASIIRRVEKNLPYVPDQATEKAVRANLRSLLVTYGLTLRKERQYHQAVKAFRRAAQLGLTLPIAVGLVRSQLLCWFSGSRRKT